MTKKLSCKDFCLFMVILLLLLAATAPVLLMALLHFFQPESPVSVLRGEFWGKACRMALLTLMPFFVLACFFTDRAKGARRRHAQDSAAPPEFAPAAERRDFYLQQLAEKQSAPGTTPWLSYLVVCGVTIMVFTVSVLQMQLFQEVQRLGADLSMYRAGAPAVHNGTLRRVERPVRGGIARVPDKRFYYYNSTAGYLRCNAALLNRPDLRQAAYEIAYLPNSGTILSIADSKGNVRTQAAFSVQAPAGYWLYGDLAVPVCKQVEGYGALSAEAQALFDLLYSQVLSASVASDAEPTRSFDLPYPIPKADFNAVMELYDATGSPERYPDIYYRTDDGKIVRTAYCQRIYHTGSAPG